MAKTKKKKCGVLGFLCKFIGRIILIFTAACAITGAILKLIDYFKSKKCSGENTDREFKEFCNFCGSKAETVDEDDVAGVISKNMFSVTTLDLSDARIRDDGFVSLTATCSAVNIIVPDDVNIKVDGLIKYTAVENFVPEDDSLPTIYIAAKALFSDIRISRQE